MIETNETIIQADVVEPTLYDVMDQLVAIHDRLDSHDDRFVSIETVLHEIQATLVLHGKALIKLTTDIPALVRP